MFFSGIVLCVVAQSFVVIVIGRFVVGIASSLSAIADIPYLLEVAPVPQRGRVSSSYEMLVVIGVVTSFAANVILTDTCPSHGWRYMFALPTPFILLQMIGMQYLPESPKFLLDKGHVEAAKIVLRMTLGDLSSSSSTDTGIPDIEIQLDEMIKNIQLLDASCHNQAEGGMTTTEENTCGDIDNSKKKSMLARQVDRISIKKRPSAYTKLSSANAYVDEIDQENISVTEVQTSPSDSGSITETIDSKKRKIDDINVFWEYRIPLVVVLTLMIFQQFTGGVVVRNYAPKIFSSAGFGYHQSLMFNLALGGMKVLSTAVAIYFVDNLGRKYLLLMGIVLSSSGMLMLVISFFAGLDNSIGIFLCAGLLITAGYSFGFGPVCWVIQSECFPTSIRGRCMAISVLVSNLGQFVMTLVFPLLMASMQTGWIFFLFFIMSMLALLFVSIYIVETKGKLPREILNSWN